MSRFKPAGFKTEDERPLIQIPDLAVLLCPEHAAMCQDKAPPDRFPIAPSLVSLGLFALGIGHPDVMRESGYDAVTGRKGDVKEIQTVLERLSPICCLVGENAVYGMLTAITAGPDAWRVWLSDKTG